MKTLSSLSVVSAALLAVSCNGGPGMDLPVRIDDADLSHGEIILGDRLENPYSLENVKSAYCALYPTKSPGDIISTDYYVRFLPSDEQQLSELKNLGINMLDHPVDYEIVRDGDYYHDPSVGDGNITWQYAVVPLDFEFPDIRYEILDQCFISEHIPSTKASAADVAWARDVDWADVEAEAFRITGNASMLEEGATKGKGGDGVNPSGRITLIDPDANGGQPVGVSGVKVMCNVFVKFSSAYTDRDGYYTLPQKFTANLRYRLVFKNSKGFSIGFNSILFPASMSTLGKNPPSGVNICIDRNSERKLYLRSVVNNSAYDFLESCSDGSMGLSVQPPADVSMWLFDITDRSSTTMLHHGTVVDYLGLDELYSAVATIVGVFLPDITIGTKGVERYSEIYSTVVHELAHSCHFRMAGKEYWNKYMMYIINCAMRGQSMYGDGSLENAGYCEVGESWAYYVSSRMFKERYGGANPAFGIGQWFHPQVFTYLEDRGLTPGEMLSVLGTDVCSMAGLRTALTDAYPAKKTAINQIFNRYE